MKVEWTLDTLDGGRTRRLAESAATSIAAATALLTPVSREHSNSAPDPLTAPAFHGTSNMDRFSGHDRSHLVPAVTWRCSLAAEPQLLAAAEKPLPQDSVPAWTHICHFGPPDGPAAALVPTHSDSSNSCSNSSDLSEATSQSAPAAAS